MNELDFFIFGPWSDSNEPMYWNLDHGWVETFDEATPFTGEILTLPLPGGATGVMPITEEGEPKGFYKPLWIEGIKLF